MLTFVSGDQSDQKLALYNIAGMVRPGGILIIDHRNYDYILETGRAPQGKNIYYKVLRVIVNDFLWFGISIDAQSRSWW